MTSSGLSLDNATLGRAAGVIKCLGHPLRLRLLEAMEDGARTVTDLQLISGATQAVVSQQLSILRGRGVVGATRRGANVFYGIIEPRVHQILACVRGCGVAGEETPSTGAA